MTHTALAALAALALTLVSCSSGSFPPASSPGPGGSPGFDGSAAPTSSVGSIAHPTGANELVLREDIDGGLVAPGWILSHIPQVSIYGDGRVITQGAQIAIYPGPALPSLVVARVSEAGLQRILAAAAGAGLLGKDASYPYPGIMDAGTTTFTMNAGGATHTVSAYALGLGEDPSVLPPAEAAARADLAAFSAKLGDLPGWLGSDVVSVETPYDFDAIRIYAQEAQPVVPEPGLSPTVVDWPLATPLASFGTPFRPTMEPPMRCGVLTGDDLATLRRALEGANQLTYWRSAGATYALTLRPLLPDESGCPAG